MATSKRNIYNKFLSKIDDRDLCRLLTDEEIIEILEMRLDESLSVYFKIIKKDVLSTNQSSPSFYRQAFTGDGINTIFTISEWSIGTLEKSTESYFIKNGDRLIDGTDYVFDLNTLTFTLSIAPLLTDVIKGGYDFSGEFFDTFTSQEEWITAIGMVLCWSSDKYFKLKRLTDGLTPKDFSSHSPANLLDKIKDLRERATYEIREAKNSYSYDGFSGFNS